jgi:hypothetical protein
MLLTDAQQAATLSVVVRPKSGQHGQATWIQTAGAHNDDSPGS